MKTCSEIMTENPICCFPDDTVIMVAQLMKIKDIGAVPVIENETSRKLVGIVTDRDLTLEVVANGRDPATARVKDVMTPNVLTCHANDDVHKVLDAMTGYQLRRIPIVDSEDQIVGIISQADVATRLDQPKSTANVLKEISHSHVYLMTR